MALPIFGWSNWGDPATVTASTQLATATSTNLQQMQPTDLWQTGGLSSIYLTADRGSSQPFNLVALLYTNLTTAATWRIRSATSSAGLTSTAPAYDSGAVSFVAAGGDTTWDRRHGLLWLPAGQTNRYLRIDLTASSADQSDVQAGRLVIGNVWQSSKVGHEQPWFHGFEDVSPRRTTPGGQTYVRNTPSRLRTAITFGYQTEAQMLDNLWDIKRRRGGQKDVLLVLNPTDTAYLHHKIVYGLMSGSDIMEKSRAPRYRHRIEITELL